MEGSEELEAALERDFEAEIKQWKRWMSVGIQRVENHLAAIDTSLLGKHEADEFSAAEKLLEELKQEALRELRDSD